MDVKCLPNMKSLGIDYGNKRIGIAVSDDSGILAFPFTTVENTPAAFSEIQRIVKEEKIEAVVVGMPMSFSGGISPQAQTVRRFGDALAGSLTCSVAYENELFTTTMAERSGASKATVDQSAAAIILQSWIDRNKKNG